MDHPQFEVGDKSAGPGDSGGPVYYVEPPPKGRGCFFYGCLFAGIFGVLGMVVVGGVTFMAWRFYSQLVDEYTSTSPLELPKVESTEDQVKDVEARWAVFKEAYDKGEAAEIVLNQDDVNILAAREPNLKDHVYFTLEEDKAKVKISFDLSDSPFPRTKGRFFNATGTVTAEVTPSGRVDIRLQDIQVGDKPMPKEFADQIGAENLADEILKDRRNREFRDKIERIEVKESKVYLKIRAAEPSSSDKAKAKDDATKEEGDAEKKSNKPAQEAPATEPPAKEDPAPVPPPSQEEPARPTEEPTTKKAA